MRSIDFNDPQELYNSFGKKCRVEYQRIGFPSEVITGTFLKVEFNTKEPVFRIIVKKGDIGVAIPSNHILSVEVEE